MTWELQKALPSKSMSASTGRRATNRPSRTIAFVYERMVVANKNNP